MGVRAMAVRIGLLLVMGIIACDHDATAPQATVAEALAIGTSRHVELVGHEPLFGRGMNAALTIFRHFVYVGNRTDGSSHCGVGDPRIDPNDPTSVDRCAHPHAGVLVVDARNPRHPTVVGEIGPPLEGNVGITSRELRVWPHEKLLMIMNFRCSSQLHACPPGTDAQFPFDIKFYDLHDPVHPRFLSSYVPTSAAGVPVKPHEMFLWTDPRDHDRALLFLSTPSVSVDPALPNLMVVDLSKVARGGAVTEVAEGNWNDRYAGAADPANYDFNLFVHSMSVSDDGSRTLLAMEAGHFLVLDTSPVAARTIPGHVQSLNDKLITDPADRPTWGNPPPCKNECANGHSAVKIPGRSLALTTDEVYGTFTDPSFGCPWGWMRLIDIADERHPKIVGEYKIAEDLRSFCGSPGDDAATEQFTSFSSHNPTVLPHLALIAWHSGGLQIIDTHDATRPEQAGFFTPAPLATVANEDPALSRGPNKVVFWSYPIVRDGLVYVIDIRNGLFILRYSGPRADEVADTHFLEGNSSLGHAGEHDEDE